MKFMNRRLKRNLLIIAGVFVLLFIILLIFGGNKNDTQRLNYVQIEQKLVDASKKYLEKTELFPQEQADTVIVSSEVLISNNYIKSFDKMTKDTNCFGQVTIQKSGESYNYMPYLICDNYRTKTFKNEIASQVRDDSEDGVYLVNNEYIYRGAKVNNYLKIGEDMWRIIKVTEDGYLKIIKEEHNYNYYTWDNRYNIELNEYSGLNDFDKSKIEDTLNNSYEKIKSGKEYFVPRYLCINTVQLKSTMSIYSNNCQSKSIKQVYMDLPNIYDLTLASLDENCKVLSDKSCNNYNYFKKFFTGSWSIDKIKDSTSKVAYNSIGYISGEDAKNQKEIYIIGYINSNNIIKSGDGSESNPYIFN